VICSVSGSYCQRMSFGPLKKESGSGAACSLIAGMASTQHSSSRRRGTRASASCSRRTRGPSCGPRASSRSRPRHRGARSTAPAGAPATGRTAAAPARSCPGLPAQSRAA
jgi:hypothetical protein